MGNKNKCCMCYTSDDDKLHLGELKSCGNVHVHYYCLLLATTITQTGRDHEGILGFLLSDINSELQRSRERTCYYCKKQGASVICFKRTCKIVFHLPCGIRNNSGHQFFGRFHSFCFNHRPKQNLPRLKDKQIFCPICYEEIAVEKKTEILWAPCCKKNSYFHKACIQIMALSAGYFFKCPICNNDKIFQETMKKYGVFVPERDASWELEPNAYRDLLHRHKECNADNCVCTRGRNYNGVGSWTIVLCYTCGSQGTHLSCNKLKKNEKKWLCAVCLPRMKNDQSDQNCEAALAETSIPPPSTTPIPAPSSSPVPSTSSALSTFEPSTPAIFNSNSPAERTTDRKGKKRKRSQVSTSSDDEIIDVVLTEPVTTESNKTNSSYIETESDSDVVVIVDEDEDEDDCKSLQAPNGSIVKVKKIHLNNYEKIKMSVQGDLAIEEENIRYIQNNCSEFAISDVRTIAREDFDHHTGTDVTAHADDDCQTIHCDADCGSDCEIIDSEIDNEIHIRSIMRPLTQGMMPNMVNQIRPSNLCEDIVVID